MIRQRFIQLIVLHVFSALTIESKTIVTLQRAIDKKYISVKATCNGGLEINYLISNLLKDSISFIVPAGWRFNSNAAKDDYQDILVTHDKLIVLKPKEVKQVEINGYCCEATKSGPIKGIFYTSGKLADSNLVKLAKYLNLNPTDKNTEQYSVWAISDNKETAHITHSNDSAAILLRALVSSIKGEPLPWYTLSKKSSISTNGHIQDYPLRFKASIPSTVAQICYSTCYIVNNKGEKVSKILGQWLLPKNATYQADFDVIGFKKGDYKLILENQQTIVFEKAFKI